VEPDLEDLRLSIYRSLAATGSVPATADLALRLGVTRDQVLAGLRDLQVAHHLALDAAGRVVLAHPFATIPLGFSVMGGSTLWWGGCVWDSFAIPQLVDAEPEVLVATRCQACGTPHAWVVGRDEPPVGGQVAHFLVPVRSMWDDVVRTCGNQRVFCSPACLDGWLAEQGLERGYVTDLATVWRLARHWYDGRLDRGYRRRDPAAATDYFRNVGLSGPFWGL
jgi:hypothetical protein